MNFNNILSQILEVDSKGFDATTDSYFSKIDTSSPDIPPAKNNQNNQAISGKNNVSTTPQAPVRNNQMTYTEAWDKYGTSQALATKAFQEANKDIDVKSILKEYSQRKDFSNAKLDEYAAELTAKYGDKYAKIDDVKKYSSDYYDVMNTIRKGDTADNKGIASKTKGSKEDQAAKEELFGWRNLLERRFNVNKGEDKSKVTYYKYLEE